MMNNLTPEQLSFRAGYEQGRFDAQVESAQQQEPVAWLVESKHGNWAPYLEWSEPSYLETQVVTPLYTSPTASKPWVGLDQHDIDVLFLNEDGVRFARYIEAKLKEKNA